jgi:hypothetical protein
VRASQPPTRGSVVALACALACACGKSDAHPVDAGTEVPAASSSSADAGNVGDEPPIRPDPEEASSRAGSATSVEVDLAPYATGRPVWGKSIGHTSVVFKLKLAGGAEAAYKPRSHRGKMRYRGEIAAYRLGRALGLTSVPPAIARSFPAAELRVALGDKESEAGKLYAAEVVEDEHGSVRGALIPWIVGLKFLALESEPSRSEWRGWLTAQAAVPSGKESLAAQISTMLVFDYLTGNWDRWSGGNIGADETGQKVLFIDNDGAFFDPPPPEPLAKQRALVREDNRFSRSFIRALRALEPSVAKSVMGEDGPGEPLLSERILAGLEARRKETLAIVDAKIAKDGDENVLAFE